MPNVEGTQGRTSLMPVQKAGVARLDEERGALGPGGIQPSVNCGNLTGQARSICYALRGVKY